MVKKRKRTTETRQQARGRELAEIEELERRIKDEAPARNTTSVSSNNKDVVVAARGGQPATYASATKFSQLPLCKRTKAGLREAKFVDMTDIQRAAIPHILAGRDVLGAARTGSGKTLAFLVPAVDLLYRKGWTQMDGVGVLIITPTRELAVQIFDVLRSFGKHHTMSAGLVIGGKNVEDEAGRIGLMNVLIATPGRLLHHMDETVGFNCDNLQMLILDEADRMLDSGFEATLNHIIGNLPPSRQTVLFSATQTKSVKDLARLSLKEPEYLSVHELAAHSTPETLAQCYLTLDLSAKLNTLWSFIKTHLNDKILVFVSTSKQVRYIFEMFRRLRPGMPLLELYGRQGQGKRFHVFQTFNNAASACLFCTDVASRGLDFPEVTWVVQFDCPEDTNAYIHRVGRSARNNKKGQAILFLTPSERAMVTLLQDRNVPIQEISVNPNRARTVTNLLVTLCTSDPALKALAQKAFKTYIKSVYVGNKEIFDVHSIDAEAYAASLGLSAAPKVTLKGVKMSQMKAKNVPFKRLAEMEAADKEDGGGVPTGAPLSLPGMPDDSDDNNTNESDEEGTSTFGSTTTGSEGGGKGSGVLVIGGGRGKGERGSSMDVGGREWGASDVSSQGSGKGKNKAATRVLVGSSSEESGEEDSHVAKDNGEVLHLVRKNVKVADDELAAELDASTIPWNSKGSKVKRGKKVVFDEDGQVVEPMAAPPRTRDETPEERMARLEAKMREADAEDKEAERRRKREKKLLKKEKERARKLGLRSTPSTGGAVAVLGGGGRGDESSEGSYEDQSDDDQEREWEREEHSTGGSHDNDDDDGESDEDDEEEDKRPKKRARSEGTTGSSLATLRKDEALALQILASRRK